MKRNLRHSALLLLLSFPLAVGCAQHVMIRPPVNSSLGYSRWQALGEIRRMPVHVGLLLDPALQQLTYRNASQHATIEIPVGEVVSAKLVQILSYKFDRITLLSSIEHAPPMVLRIGLQSEKPVVGVSTDAHADFWTGIATVDVVAKVDMRLRAVLSDHQEVVWVGTPQIIEEFRSGGIMVRATDTVNQASDLTNRITDRIVAELVQQMQRSAAFQQYLEGKRI